MLFGRRAPRRDVLSQVVYMPQFRALIDRDRVRPRGGQSQRIGQPGILIAPPDRRSRFRPDLLYEAGADQFASDLLRRGDFEVRRGDKIAIVALRSGAQHQELRLGELDGHG